MFTISLEERKWVAENAILTVGLPGGRTFKIANMDILVKRFRDQRFKEGLSANLSIIPMKEDVKKVHSYTYSVFYDRQFDVRYGIYTGLNKTGEPNFQRLELRETTDLDLTRDDDVRYWIVTRFHPKLSGSPFEERAYYKIFDSSLEILGKTTKMQAMMKAVKKVSDMKLKEKIYFLRFIQIELKETYNEEIIDGLLYQKIEADPFAFLSKYESTSRSIHEIFSSAVILGVIAYAPDKGYSFDGIKIGNVDYDAIAFISKDKMMFANIIDRIGKSDHITSSIEHRTKKREEQVSKKVDLTPKEETIVKDDPNAW